MPASLQLLRLARSLRGLAPLFRSSSPGSSHALNGSTRCETSASLSSRDGSRERRRGRQATRRRDGPGLHPHRTARATQQRSYPRRPAISFSSFSTVLPSGPAVSASTVRSVLVHPASSFMICSSLWCSPSSARSFSPRHQQPYIVLHARTLPRPARAAPNCDYSCTRPGRSGAGLRPLRRPLDDSRPLTHHRSRIPPRV